MRHLFEEPLQVVNIGIPTFSEEIIKQGANAVQLKWTPPAGGDPELLEMLKRLDDEKVDRANQKALEAILAAEPVLIDVAPALEVIPKMTEHTILHAGPPIRYADMCGAMKGAVAGALIYEGLAADADAADTLALSGKIKFAPCNEHSTVGPMAGIVSASMPVHIIKNKNGGNLTFSTINEGLGKVLRFGANSEEVLERLVKIQKIIAPTLKEALKIKPIELKPITAQAFHMGDECHNRNKAATSLFFRELAPVLMELPDRAAAKATLDFIGANDHYFLNLSMASCKCALDTAVGIAHATLVTVMSRNGVEFGIRIASLPDQWFTGPAQMVKGLLFPGFTEEDCTADLGDSTITETMGIGGFSMAAAPAIVQFVGGTVSDALNYSRSMYDITIGENPMFSLPALNFRGSPIGIDIRKVVATGILPIINTGIAHKKPGIGQVGAGIVTPPMVCFEKALAACHSRV